MASLADTTCCDANFKFLKDKRALLELSLPLCYASHFKEEKKSPVQPNAAFSACLWASTRQCRHARRFVNLLAEGKQKFMLSHLVLVISCPWTFFSLFRCIFIYFFGSVSFSGSSVLSPIEMGYKNCCFFPQQFVLLALEMLQPVWTRSKPTPFL